MIPGQKQRVARKQITPMVLEVLDRHKGLDITLNQIMSESGLTTQQVQHVMLKLAQGDAFPVTVLVKGQRWRLEASNAQAPKSGGKNLGLFEQVGELSDGSLVVRDEDGKLFKLTQL